MFERELRNNIYMNDPVGYQIRVTSSGANVMQRFNTRYFVNIF